MPADGSICTTRARYQALSPGSSDAIATMQSSSHQVASQMLRSARHRRQEFTGGHLQDHQAASGALQAVGGLHLRDPRRQALGLPDHARAHRVGLLGLQAGHHDQERGPAGRPRMQLCDTVHDVERPRLADRVHAQGVELVDSLRSPVGSERQRPAVGGPARLVVVVRTVRDLTHPGTVGCREADPPDGVPFQPFPLLGAERDARPVGGGPRVGHVRRSAQSRPSARRKNVLDVLVEGRLAKVALHPSKDRRDRACHASPLHFVRGHRTARHPRRP